MTLDDDLMRLLYKLIKKENVPIIMCTRSEMYNYILSTNILNKKKKEDKIFISLVQGYNAEEISKKHHYSVPTILNRRKDIYNKTKRYMK